MLVWLFCKTIIPNCEELTSLYIFTAVNLFYFGTLEEYYVGGLHLRLGNGITDGAIPVIGGMILVSFTGNEVMTIELIAGNEYTRISSLIIYTMVIFSL